MAPKLSRVFNGEKYTCNIYPNKTEANKVKNRHHKEAYRHKVRMLKIGGFWAVCISDDPVKKKQPKW